MSHFMGAVPNDGYVFTLTKIIHTNSDLKFIHQKGLKLFERIRYIDPLKKRNPKDS